MNITKALWVLERAHTRDDDPDGPGYTVQMQADLFGDIGRAEYIEAWGVLRAYLRQGGERVVIAIDPAKPDADTLVGVIVQDGKVTRIMTDEEIATLEAGS